MLNEIQVKQLDKGWWPNRALKSIHGKWDVSTPYMNRSQRRNRVAKKKVNLRTHYIQLVGDKTTGVVKRIIHVRK